MSSLKKIKNGGPKIGKFRRPISVCNHLLYARKRYHNYVGRSSEATGTRDRLFRASKKSKIEVRYPSITRTKKGYEGIIVKFRRPISECNHLLYARKRYHNYVGRSAEATGTRDR